MTWLVDAQLPPRLCAWLEHKGETSLHVASLSSEVSLPDSSVWEYAKQNSCVVLSKDRDFYDRAILLGAPPQVVHITVGNCSNPNLFDILDRRWNEIVKAIQGNSPLVVVTKSSVQTF